MKIKKTDGLRPHPLLSLPQTLVFVRHGESTGNIVSRDERVLWDTPNHAYPLTPRGVCQAKEAGMNLARIFDPREFRYGFCSTMTRSQETLHVIHDYFQFGKNLRVGNIISDSRLDEKWDGIYHDLTGSQITARYPEQEALHQRTGYYHFRAPGGENCIDVEIRMRHFFTDAVRKDDYKMLVCGHGSWLMAMRRLIEGWSVSQFNEFKKSKEMTPPNCGVYVYEKEDSGSYSLTTYFSETLSEETALA